ncbi:hypothetical protein D9757_011500 [Collybiopsis confluens]|uniref:Uncharacterized protein n=1 Tax=Collybiopsis confluens TaxID=2823264 RepID=A0A8H5GVQ6_9AGAR|nr:hypothetical protein D9757_011500 [Collybiopsis confluens]
MVPNEIIESLIMAFPPLCTTVSSFPERLKKIEGFLTAPPPPSGQELSKRFLIDFDLRAKDRWYESPPKLYYGYALNLDDCIAYFRDHQHQLY